MTELTRLRWAIAAHAATTFAGVAAFRVIASYDAIALGFTATELGLLAASFAVPPLVVAFPAGRWTDRIGGLRVMVAGDVLIVAAALLPMLVGGAWALLTSAAGMGLGALLSIVGQHAMIGATIPRHDQERVFAALFTANSVGQMIGPLAGTISGSVLAASGTGLSVEAGYGVAIALAAVGASTLGLFDRDAWRSQPRDVADQPPPALQAIGDIIAVKGATPILCFTAIIVAIIDMLSIFLPAWGAERQVAPVVIGTLLALRSAASIVVRFGMLQIIALVGRRAILVGSAVLTAVALAALPFADLAFAHVIAIALGLALGLGPPISLAWVSTTMPARIRGSAIGLRILANRSAQAVVPTVIGMASAGSSGVFLLSAGLIAVTSLLVWRVPFERR